MTDDLLARDGYSEQPPLLRALALALVSVILILADGPRVMVVLLGASAALDYRRFVRRRRDRLSRPRAR